MQSAATRKREHAYGREQRLPCDASDAVFSALQEQLGLKLEAQKAPIEMLVIDHADKVPVEN